MRLTKIALGVAVGIGGAAAANAADVAMFPYIVSSPSVTTILTIIDRGRSSTGRYNADGRPSSSGRFLHWGIHYKQGANIDNAAPCNKFKDVYMPTDLNEIISVDVGRHFTGDVANGVLFNDDTGDDVPLDVPLIEDTTLPIRGVFFANNSDDHVDVIPAGTNDYTRNYEPDEREMQQSTYAGTVQGEAMIFEFAGGAAWGYKAELKDSGNNDDPTDFSYTNLSSTGVTGKPWPLVAFMPLDEVTTKLAVTPVDDRGEGMLGRGGSGALRSPSVTVGLRTTNPLSNDAPIGGITDPNSPLFLNNNVGVAFNRDGTPVPGAVDVVVNCVGAVTVDELMTSAAWQALREDGGYGLLSITSEYTDQYMDQAGHAIVYKVEYKDTLESAPNNPYPRNPTFNGQNLGEGFQTFNTGMKL